MSRHAALAAVGAGWRPAVAELLDELHRLDPGCVVWRVDGGAALDVRVQVDRTKRRQAAALVAEARARTRAVCAHCGHPGRVHAAPESAVVLCAGCAGGP